METDDNIEYEKEKDEVEEVEEAEGLSECENKEEDICEVSIESSEIKLGNENEGDMSDDNSECNAVTEDESVKSEPVNEDSGLSETASVEELEKTSELDDVTVIDSEISPDNINNEDATAENVSPEEPQNKDFTEDINQNLDAIEKTGERTLEEVKKIHKEYFNVFSGQLKAMQDELDRYHEIDQGRCFDDILSALARIYVNYETLDEEMQDPKAQKNVRYLLLDLMDLLESYGVERIKSTTGEVRNLRHSKVIERIPTDNPEMDKTVAFSHNSGFCKGNKTIVEEKIDIYTYSKESEGSEDTETEGN